MVQMMSNIMYHVPAIQKEYKLAVIAERPNPDDLVANTGLIDELLRSRKVKVEAQIDGITTNSSKHSLIASSLAGSSTVTSDNATTLTAIYFSALRKGSVLLFAMGPGG